MWAAEGGDAASPVSSAAQCVAVHTAGGTKSGITTDGLDRHKNRTFKRMENGKQCFASIDETSKKRTAQPINT